MNSPAGVAYGHSGCTCFHPLFVFNQHGDLERCALRPGNVHSADGWEQVLKPVVARYRGAAKRIAFRGDAAFAQPNMYEFFEAEVIEHAIRLPANQILQERIGHLLRRPVGRPAHYAQRFYKSFRRMLATPEPIHDWSLTSLHEKPIKIGAKVVSHGRYVAFQMAEVAIPRHLFADILRLIATLRAPPVSTTAT